MGTAAQFGKIQLRFVNGPLLLMRGLCHGVSAFLFFLSITSGGLPDPCPSPWSRN